jgi:hypothetical protein
VSLLPMIESASMTTPSQPSAFKLRRELAELWSELEGWVVASDAWTETKDAAASAANESVPNTPAGYLTAQQMDDVEEWRQLFRDELASVRTTLDSIPARSTEELEAAISAARRLTDVPRRGFRQRQA